MAMLSEMGINVVEDEEADEEAAATKTERSRRQPAA